MCDSQTKLEMCVHIVTLLHFIDGKSGKDRKLKKYKWGQRDTDTKIRF